MLKRFSALLAFAAAAALTAACAQSDAGITTKVKTKLAADPTVKASQIDVDTKNKVVTLNGTVDSQAAKDQAISIARSTTGVADVVDNLTVAGGPPGTTGATGTMGATESKPATGTGDMGMPASTTPGMGTGTTGTTGTGTTTTPGTETKGAPPAKKPY